MRDDARRQADSQSNVRAVNRKADNASASNCVQVESDAMNQHTLNSRSSENQKQVTSCLRQTPARYGEFVVCKTSNKEIFPIRFHVREIDKQMGFVCSQNTFNVLVFFLSLLLRFSASRTRATINNLVNDLWYERHHMDSD